MAQLCEVGWQQDSHSLTFHWNLGSGQRKQSPPYRHLLCIYHNKIEVVRPAINTYIRRLKGKDKFSILYADSELCFRCLPLREKKPIQNDYIGGRAIMSGLRDRIIEKAEKDCEGATIVSIFLQHVGDMGWFLQKVQERRMKDKLRVPVAFFGPFQSNRIDFHSGIHQLSTNIPALELMSYFHSLMNSVKLQTARIAVTCLHETLLPSDASTWSSPDFNQIERSYLYLPSKYKTDTIHLQTTLPKLTLEVQIHFKMFGAEEQSYAQTVRVQTGGGKKLEEPKVSPYFDEKMELAENPYESFCRLAVEKGLGDAQEIE